MIAAANLTTQWRNSMPRSKPTARSRRRDGGHKLDYVLAVLTFVLVVFGLVVLSSASAVSSYDQFHNNSYYFKHQLIYGALMGGVLLYLGSRINYHVWKRFAFGGMVTSIILLALVFAPHIGFSFNGARRWIHLGGFSLQPSEVVKLTMIVYLAAWLENKGEHIKNLKYSFLPFVTVLAVVALLILKQPDLGTLSVIVLSSVVMYFVAGAPMTHFSLMGAGMVGAFLLLVKFESYRLARLAVFLNPEADVRGAGYQINQALIAVGSGGLFGLGLGKSRQKYNYLPEATGDSIYAIVSEELGLVGAVAIVLLFMGFLYRGIRIAQRAPDVFGKLVAVGITAWIVLQAFINIGAIISLIPLTGIPLPFISYGGSALMFALFGVGILLNISKHTVEPAPVRGGERVGERGERRAREVAA